MTIHDQLAARSSLPASAGRTAVLPPGFRFHPTDEELILHYLRRRAAAVPCPAPIIAEVDIYKLDPWELPARAAVFGQFPAADGNSSNEWYFFSPRERKYPNGVRPNRAAGSGYWKATGTDKPITTTTTTTTGGSSCGEMIGVKKALVFYQGRPPKGMKTNWIMHEYRLAAAGNTYRPPPTFKDASMRLDDWVLCRIYKKPDQQLMYEQSSSMEYDGAIAHHHQHRDVVPMYHHHGAGEPSRPTMPRPPSISDYLVDYSAVSELFDSMPPAEPETQSSSAADRFFLDLTAAAATGDEDASTPTTRKRQQSSVDETSRWLSDASTTTTTMPMMNTSPFSMPPGQSSPQDRI